MGAGITLLTIIFNIVLGDYMLLVPTTLDSSVRSSGTQKRHISRKDNARVPGNCKL